MSKITALYSRLSVGDEDRDGGESNSIQNQRLFLEQHAGQQQLKNIKHYVDDDESGRFFDRPAYSAMIEDVRNGKIGTIIIKDMTRWGRDYLEVGNAMEVMRIHNVRFIAINSGIDSAEPSTLEFAPFINIMSEWYAKDISKKVKTGIRTKGMSGKPVVTEAPYGYIKDPNKKDYWIIDEPAAEIVCLIFNLFMSGNNRNQIVNYLQEKQIPTPSFYMKDQDRGTRRNNLLDESNRFKWNKFTLTRILTTDKEYNLWLSKHRASKLGKTDYFIRMLKGSVIKVYFFSEVLNNLCRELKKIGVNLNQIAYYANAGYFPQAEQEIRNIYRLYADIVERLKIFLDRPLINARIVESEGE